MLSKSITNASNTYLTLSICQIEELQDYDQSIYVKEIDLIMYETDNCQLCLNYNCYVAEYKRTLWAHSEIQFSSHFNTKQKYSVKYCPNND